MRVSVLLLLFSASLPSALLAQQPAPASTTPLTLHANAKLVVVDVVVTASGPSSSRSTA